MMINKVDGFSLSFFHTGNDGDTLGSDTVLVYDTSDFPAHVVAWLREGKGDL